MTLVEVMVATALGSLVMLVLASLTLFSARSFSSMVNYTDLNKDSRIALDRMSKEIRQSRGLVKRTPTSLTFKLDGGQEVSYVYDAQSKKITENKGTASKTVLKNCTFWTHTIYRQNPPNDGSFNFIPTTDPTYCKMVQISWKCVSDTMQRQTNSANLQSMKVVIRKTAN